MQENSKTISTIIIALALLVVGIMGIIKWINGGIGSVLEFISSQSQSTYQSKYNINDFETIKIFTDSTDIEIKPGLDGEIKLEYYSNDDNTPEIYGDLRTLRIDDRNNDSTCDGFCIISHRLVLNVPIYYDKSIEIITSSGNLDSTVNLGTLVFQSDSGSLSAYNITGNANIHTSSGDVSIDNFRALRESLISSYSGNISITNCDNYVDASTVSGNININKNNSSIVNLKITTTSGDIDIN